MEYEVAENGNNASISKLNSLSTVYMIKWVSGYWMVFPCSLYDVVHFYS